MTLRQLFAVAGLTSALIAPTTLSINGVVASASLTSPSAGSTWFRSWRSLYLVGDGSALEIGIAAPGSDRLPAHRRRGWQHLWSIRLATGDDAYNLEQTVLRWWRDELVLPPFYSASGMPQQGATETVAANEVTPGDVLEFVLCRLEEQGVHWPRVLVPNEALQPPGDLVIDKSSADG